MEREVRLKNLVAYGLGDVLGGGSFLIIGTLFLTGLLFFAAPNQGSTCQGCL